MLSTMFQPKYILNLGIVKYHSSIFPPVSISHLIGRSDSCCLLAQGGIITSMPVTLGLGIGTTLYSQILNDEA
jgi:hypothetical protein